MYYTQYNIATQVNKNSANSSEPSYLMMKNQIALEFMNVQSFTDDLPAAHVVWMNQVKPDRGANHRMITITRAEACLGPFQE